MKNILRISLPVLVSILAFGASAPLASAQTATSTTNPATSITTTDATLNGTVGSDDAANTSFWWGPTSAGPFTAEADPSAQVPSGWAYPPTGTGAQVAGASFSYPLTGLTPNTTYYFAAWVNVGGTWYPGDVLSFTTTARPVSIDANNNGTVDPGEQTFSTIQAAVAAASSTDTIMVAAGTYAEHVTIDKSLTLKGARAGIDARTRATTTESIIDGGLVNSAITVDADDVTIDGFTIQNGVNGDNAGIASRSTNSDFKVLNNILTNNVMGLYGQCASDCLVQFNLFDNNNLAGASNGNGIYAENSNGLTIDKNEFKNQDGNGVNLATSIGTTTPTHTNLLVSDNFFHNIAASNLYILGVNGGVFSGNTILPAFDATGISFSGDDTNIEVTGNTITAGARAIRVEDAGYGLPTNSDITVNENFFSGNTQFALGLLNVSTTNAYSGIMDATGNWWGSATGPTVATNPSGSGDPIVVSGMATGEVETDHVNYGSFCVNATCTTPVPTSTTTPERSGGGGGGSVACRAGTAYNPSTRSCTPIGQVLGASTGPDTGCTAGALFSSTTGQSCTQGKAGTFTFTMNLSRGMHSSDVMELQKFLVAAGYSIPDAVTDYFGAQTFAAVKAFQKDRGLPQTGFVGPLTRAELNKGN